MSTITEILTRTTLEYITFTSVFLTFGVITELSIRGYPDAAKRALFMKQTLHSLPALYTGVLGTNMWRAYLDPFLPYYNYYDTHEYTWSLFAQNVVVFFIVYDTCFYWFHYLLHIQHPINLYRMFHKEHHYQHISLWATTATHPVEIMLNVLGLHLAKVFTPIPVWLHYGFLLFTHFSGVVAHDANLDIFGHHVHHTKHNCNYAGYLGIWDWIMGTRDVDINVPKVKKNE